MQSGSQSVGYQRPPDCALIAIVCARAPESSGLRNFRCDEYMPASISCQSLRPSMRMVDYRISDAVIAIS